MPSTVEANVIDVRDVVLSAGMLTTRDAARRLGMSERTVRRAIGRGDLVATKEGAAFRIAAEALEHYRALHLHHPRTPRAISSAPAPLFRPQGLPTPLTSLVGREHEQATLAALLVRSGVRLVTLTGPGGVGKTRLAIAAAACATIAFRDGVAFVDLAPVQDAAEVGAAIAQALRVREAGDRPIVANLVAHLHHRRLLLFLDNFEHVLPAAPLVSQLLAACPEVTVLVTSRAPLRIAGEHIVSVSPLSVPEPSGRGAGDEATAVERSPAGRLFVERATAARDGFSLTTRNALAIAEICRRLDGLPLAIELAAARCAVLSPEMLLAHLDRRLSLLSTGRRDAPPRMQSLRESIAWSHDLLAPAEQALFRRLAVFTGGFTLEAAEAMAGNGWQVDSPDREAATASEDDAAECFPAARSLSPAPATVDLISALVAHNLLTRHDQEDGSVRFGMLETVREFALTCLHEHAEARTAHYRQAGYYLAHFTRADQVVPRPENWWWAFEADWDNLRAAMTWAAAAEETELGLRLFVEVFGYWMLRGQIGEGINWLERLLAPGAHVPAALCCRATTVHGCFRWLAGDLDRADRLLSEAVVGAEALGDPLEIAFARYTQGFVAEARDDLDTAARHFTAARGLYIAAGVASVAATVTAHLARVVARSGQSDRAEAMLTAALQVLDHAPGGAWAAASAWTDLGLLIAARDLPEAARCVANGLRRFAAIGDQSVFILALTAAAQIAAMGRRPEAANLLGAASALSIHSGPSIWTVARFAFDHGRRLVRQAMDEPQFARRFAEGGTWGVGEAIAAALTTMEQAATLAPGSTVEQTAIADLSPRESTVLRLISAGHTDQEAAAILGLQVRTVNTYMANVRRKLGVPSRAAAVAAAFRRGFA